MSKIQEIVGNLRATEPHPMAVVAMRWVTTYLNGNGGTNAMLMQEAFSSCAINGNRMGQICGETPRRVLAGEPVSDRYILGLAWAIRYITESEE